MFKALPARGVAVAATLLAVFAGLSTPAHAQVNKCTQADGSVSYQSNPCSGAEPPAERVTAAQLNAAQRARDQAQARARARAAADPYADSASSRPHAPGPLKPSVASPLPEDAKIVTADDRKRACTIALNNEAVLSRQTKAYTFDRQGNRDDIAPGDRAGRLAVAKRNEAKYCK